MSLFVWKAPVLEDTDEAGQLLALEDESVFESSADLGRFFAELLERYPPPEALAREELERGTTPWADSPEGSDRLVSLSIRWSADAGDLDAIVALAHEHELLVYDPQGPSLYAPGDRDAPYAPGVGEFVRGAGLAALGALVGVVGWNLSLPVLGWVLLFVGGFVALVAVLSLVAITLERQRPR